VEITRVLRHFAAARRADCADMVLQVVRVRVCVCARM
jgi:hypothetical protein